MYISNTYSKKARQYVVSARYNKKDHQDKVFYFSTLNEANQKVEELRKENKP